MTTILIIVHVVLAAALIGIVLVQRGQGATMGAAFGSGASGTVFGARGAGNFLTRTTGWLAVGFFGISLTLAVLAARNSADVENDVGVAGTLVEEPQQAPAEAPGDEATTVTPEIPTEGGTDDSQGAEASGAATAEDIPALPAETESGSTDESDDGGASGN